MTAGMFYRYFTKMKYTEKERLAFARSHQWDWPKNNISKTAMMYATSVVGGHGFGYVRDENGDLVEMPHAGNVVISDNVLIRDFVTVDRAVVGSTVIGEGTKVDHHSHIAHGAKIGKHNTFANGCIIEGSCEIGDFNTFGAGVIVQTKVKIGSGNIIGSGSVITKDIPDNEVWVGNPARFLRKNL